MSNTRPENFYENLANASSNGIGFIAHTIHAKGYLNTPPPLLTILGIENNDLSNIAVTAIENIEEYEKENNEWLQFKWRLWAFFELQDIFDAPIFKHMADLNSSFRLWYFYYESKYILIESLLLGLNGFYYSSSVILRQFLEFNVLQNYYYLRTINSSSYLDVIKCLDTGINPKWSTLIKSFLPNKNPHLPLDTIKNRIEGHYEALSENSIHPYHEKFSPKIISGASNPTHSLAGIMTFWRSINLILESVIWMYYANFPMVLQPKDLLKKFGYNGPVGIFIDSSRSHIMKNALRREDLAIFQKFSDHNENVKSLNEWYNSQIDLTEEEIVCTWNKEDGKVPESIDAAKLLNSARLRAIRESAALQNINDTENETEFPHIELSLTFCSKIFANKNKKSFIKK